MSPSSSTSEPARSSPGSATPGPGAGEPTPGPAGVLLGTLFAAPAVDAELSDRRLLAALLDVEAGLALAGADAGAIPREAAETIAAACDPARFDVAALGAAADASGNPVVPLVRALGQQLPAGARPWVHHGATSQDVLDTALVLLARRAGTPLLADAADAADACAALARTHRDTLSVARTLGQQALPTTFGLQAAGWLAGLDTAVARLRTVLTDRLAVQLGGAAGTLASLGDRGPAVVNALARRLELAEPPLPWHTDRQRLLDLAAALAGLAVALGKAARDVGLLAQTELGELSEGGTGRGGSSAMPHKRNPVDAVLVTSAAIRVPGLLATAYVAGVHEHARAAGAWHAEWPTLRELLSVVGGAAAHGRRMLADLQVHPDRMRADLAVTGGALLAESVAARLAPALGRTDAHDLVTRCVARAGDDGVPLGEALRADPTVSEHLSPQQIDAALDPAGWLGAAGVFVDRALAAHEELSEP